MMLNSGKLEFGSVPQPGYRRGPHRLPPRFPKERPPDRTYGQNRSRRFLLCSAAIVAILILSLVLVGVITFLAVYGQDHRENEQETQTPKLSDCRLECQYGLPNTDCDTCVCDSSFLLTGLVMDLHGRPLFGVEIADADKAQVILATTDSLGNFRVEGFCPIVHELVTRKDGYVTAVTRTVVEDISRSTLMAVMETQETPYFVQEPVNKHRVVGDSVRLCCKADGNPAPTVSWIKDGSPLHTSSNTLLLTSLTKADEGAYQCQAQNTAGSTMSNKAQLVVSDYYDTCRQPMDNVIQLPSTCIQPDTNSASYNIGTCKPNQCIIGDDQTRCQDQYCCQPDVQDVVEIQCHGHTMFVIETVSCKCDLCEQTDIVISGVVELASSNGERIPGIGVFLNDRKVATTGVNGEFSLRVPSQEAEVPMTFKDERLNRQAIDTTYVITTTPSLNVYQEVQMLPVPSPIMIDTVPGDNIEVSIGDSARLIVQPDTFVTETGELYDGTVLVYVTHIDLQDISESQLVPGDLNAGQLRSYVVFTLAFTDIGGNPLWNTNPLQIVADSDIIQQLIDANIHLWRFNTKTGLWEQFQRFIPVAEDQYRRQQQRFFEAPIRLTDSWNWFIIGQSDSEPNDICWVKVVPYGSNVLVSDVLQGTKITAISGEGAILSYRLYEDVVDCLGVCIPVGCQGPEVQTPYVSYLTATLGSGRLFPADTLLSGFSLSTNDISNLRYSIDSAMVGSSIKIEAQTSQITEEGPLFIDEETCVDSQGKHFQFYADQTTASWGSWESWEPCSVTCDEGLQPRRRICNTGILCGDLESFEERTCMDILCIGTWMNWGSWSSCSATCGNGLMERIRRCSESGRCGDDDTQTQDCNLRQCDGQFGQWESWALCSASCEDGERTRVRVCQDESCAGDNEETEPCNNGPCPVPGQWGPWSQCSVSCGEGQRTRSREFGDELLEEEGLCNLSCDSAFWTDWSSWSECPVSCGSGQEIRTRVCEVIGDAICEGSNDQETRICIRQCPYWSDWNAWGSCDVLCGLGTQQRTRTCLDPDETGGQCTGLTTDSQDCNNICVWTTWLEWGACGETCGGSTRQRIRICRDPDEDSISDVFCAGQPLDTEACSDWPCPDCGHVCSFGVLNAECDACECDSSALNGFVHDVNNRPLSGVTIAYEDRPYIPLVQMTDASGRFAVSGVCATQTGIIATKNLYGRVAEQTDVSDATTSTIDITMERMELPLIVDNPRSKMRAVSESVVLCCMATGNPPVTKYEWFRNGDIIESPESTTEMLTLSELDTTDSGTYRCRATNKAGSVYSDQAVLTVSASSSDSSNSDPITNILRLPPDCDVPEYDVGGCLPVRCGGVQDDQTQCRDTNEYCFTVADTEIEQISCTNGDIRLQKVVQCGCGPCAVLPIRIYGRAASDDSPLILGVVFLNNEQIATTNLQGSFDFEITEQVTRISLTFKDNLFNNLVETTRVVDVESGSNIFLIVRLKNRPTPFQVSSSDENSIPIAGEEFEPVGEIVIPPDCIYDANGDLYTGPVNVYVTNIDMRRESDLEAAPGDFTTVDIEGNTVDLKSYGIFTLDITTPGGDRLSVGGTVPMYIDPSVVPAVDEDVGPDGVSTVRLWDLNKSTGSWEQVSDLTSTSGRRRRRQTADIYAGELEFTWDKFYNLDDYDVLCYAKMISYATRTYSTSEILDDARFDSLIRDTVGGDIPFNQIAIGWQRSSNSYGGQGSCVNVGCNMNATLESFVSSNLYGNYLIPEGNQTMLTISQPTLALFNFFISIGVSGVNDAIMLRIDRDDLPSISPLVSPPLFLDRTMCLEAGAGVPHFRFYLSLQQQLAMVSKSDIQNPQTCPQTMNGPTQLDVTRFSFYPRLAPSGACPDDPCFLRIRVSSSQDILRIYAKSYAGNPTLVDPMTSSPDVLYGIRQVNAIPDDNGMVDVCIEYKCPGIVWDGTMNVGADDTTRVRLEIWNYNNNTQYTCQACYTTDFWANIQSDNIGSTIPVCGNSPVSQSSWDFHIDQFYSPDAGVYGTAVNIMNVNEMCNHNVGNCEVSGATNGVALEIVCP